MTYRMKSLSVTLSEFEGRFIETFVTPIANKIVNIACFIYDVFTHKSEALAASGLNFIGPIP